MGQDLFLAWNMVVNDADNFLGLMKLIVRKVTEREDKIVHKQSF